MGIPDSSLKMLDKLNFKWECEKSDRWLSCQDEMACFPNTPSTQPPPHLPLPFSIYVYMHVRAHTHKYIHTYMYDSEYDSKALMGVNSAWKNSYKSVLVNL